MKIYMFATTITILSALIPSSYAYSATAMEIGQTNSDIDAERGCAFSKSNDENPKLVKKLSNDGKYGHFLYENTSGGEILREGGIWTGNNYKPMAALNINGKEELLDSVKFEDIKCPEEAICPDEIEHEKVNCTQTEYANRDFRLVVKQLTNHSSCFPESGECAGRAISALVTIQSAQSKTSLVVVGNCGE